MVMFPALYKCSREQLLFMQLIVILMFSECKGRPVFSMQVLQKGSGRASLPSKNFGRARAIRIEKSVSGVSR